jgi:hypothetical protein
MDTDNSHLPPAESAVRVTRLPIRLSVLIFVGILVAGSTALGFYYYYDYSPPLIAADIFMDAMESQSPEQLREIILIRVGDDSDDLREATDTEIDVLLSEPFKRGRILDQRRRDGSNRSYHSLVYREPDGQIYALLVTELEGRYHVVVPDSPMSDRQIYLWDYVWTN